MSLERISKNPEDQSAIVHGAGARKISAMATQEVHTVLNSRSSTNSATSASAAAKAYHGQCDSCSDRNSSDAGIQLSSGNAAQWTGCCMCTSCQPNHNVTLQHFPAWQFGSRTRMCNTRRLHATKLQVDAVVVPTYIPYLRDVT